MGERIPRGWTGVTLALLLSLVAQPAAWPASELPEPFLVDVWQREDGLPQNSVQALARDHDGYLWLGTQAGLVRFDGTRLVVFDRTNVPVLTSAYVNALAVDAAGTLWIGTSRGLYRRAGGRFTAAAEHGVLSREAVQALESVAGTLWVGTLQGLARLGPGGEVSFLTTGEGLPNDAVQALVHDADGDLWIGTQDGLARFAQGRLATWDIDDGLVSQWIEALLVDRQGRLWIGTSRGLQTFDGDRFRSVETPTPSGVTSLFEDRRGHLWIGTQRGAAWSEEALTEGFEELGSLSVTTGLVFLEDPEGSLWIGGRMGGLNRLRPGRFATFGAPEGLPGNEVRAIFEDRDGDVWIGTTGGLARLAVDGTLTRYTARDGLPPDLPVFSVYQDHRARIWIGTGDGLYRFEDGRIRGVPLGRDLIFPRVNAFAEDADGTLWVGTEGDGIFQLARGSIRRLNARDGLAGDAVRQILPDRSGGIWIATLGGVSHWSADGLRSWTSRDGLPVDHVLALHLDAEGVLWMGTAEGGLARWDGRELRTISLEDGLWDSVILRILEDRRGNFWMTSNAGVFRVARAELEAVARGESATVESIVYSESDGMRSAECNGGSHPAGWQSRDGRLWFPTIRGVAVLDPSREIVNEVPPPVVIEKALADGEPMTARLEPGVKTFELHFAALSFLDPEEIRFRYRLEGFEEGWSEPSERRSARYTNLSPGSYQFHVIARNNDGVWNEAGASFGFELRPAFHQTPYFYLLCGLGAVAIGRTVHLLAVRNLLRHNEQLRRMKAELEAKNVEIETKNAELQRFTYTVSHDLKSPLYTIQGFLGFLEKDAREGRVERVARDVEHIRGAAAKMRVLLDELLELSRIGRKDHPPEAAPLGELVDEALELVAGHLRERDAQVVVAQDLPVVVGDRPRLVGALQNLIDNAVKYTAADVAPRIEVSAWRDGEEVVCRVADNGIGIDPRHHERVFGLFERLDPRQGDGTGLGLALVKRVIEVHGGTIRVESEGQGKGKGSAFVFTLPAAGPDGAGLGAMAPRPLGSERGG